MILSLNKLSDHEKLAIRLEQAFVEGKFYSEFTEYLLEENTLPDYIYNIQKEIESIPMSLVEDYFHPPADHYSANDEGPQLIARGLNMSQDRVRNMIADPKKAGYLFRTIRRRIEDLEAKQDRMVAERGGIITSLIYTLKRAAYWLIRTFRDITDDIADYWMGREIGESRTKRDYRFIQQSQDAYLARNTNWYNSTRYI